MIPATWWLLSTVIPDNAGQQSSLTQRTESQADDTHPGFSRGERDPRRDPVPTTNDVATPTGTAETEGAMRSATPKTVSEATSYLCPRQGFDSLSTLILTYATCIFLGTSHFLVLFLAQL